MRTPLLNIITRFGAAAMAVGLFSYGFAYVLTSQTSVVTRGDAAPVAPPNTPYSPVVKGESVRVPHSPAAPSRTVISFDGTPGTTALRLSAIATRATFRPAHKSLRSGDIRIKPDGSLDIVRGAVGRHEIARHAIHSDNIDDNEVTSRAIRDETITDDDISDTTSSSQHVA